MPDDASAASIEESSRWFAQQNMAHYLGKWVAVVGHSIIASGTDLKQVLTDARRKAPTKVPYVTAVPHGTVTA
jgi:hypothetical protein